MDSSLRLVIERFPDLRERAQLCFERDDDFQELCEEYRACSEALGRAESGGAVDDPLRREYGALRLRLEGELLRYLEDHHDG